MEEMLREAGDSTTRVSTEPRGQFSPYGQTRWQPDDQALFMGALAQSCLLSPADTEWLLQEMREVIPDQRWGVIQEFGGAVKGGWGPDDDGAYLVRQFGVVPAPGGGEFVVAAATRSPSGTFGEGIDSLDEISRWLV